jgi:hypothetical protein
MHASAPVHERRKAGDIIVKALPLLIVGIPLTAIIGIGAVLMLIGSGMTAGAGGGGGLLIAILGLGLISIYWFFGIRWILKKDK